MKLVTLSEKDHQPAATPRTGWMLREPDFLDR